MLQHKLDEKDAQRRATERARSELEAANRALSEGRALVIAINKWDAVTDKQKLLLDIRGRLAAMEDEAFRDLPTPADLERALAAHDLTEREFHLLETLMRHPGQVLSKVMQGGAMPLVELPEYHAVPAPADHLPR